MGEETQVIWLNSQLVDLHEIAAWLSGQPSRHVIRDPISCNTPYSHRVLQGAAPRGRQFNFIVAVLHTYFLGT